MEPGSDSGRWLDVIGRKYRDWTGWSTSTKNQGKLEQNICITRYYSSQFNDSSFKPDGEPEPDFSLLTVICMCQSFHPQLIQYLFKGSCTYSAVDGQCCLSHGADGGVALVSTPTQFPENPLPLRLQLWQNAGDDNLWTWTIKKKIKMYRTMWCSITRRGHIKSQYLQIIRMNSTML